jgi:hypothetical protein
LLLASAGLLASGLIAACLLASAFFSAFLLAALLLTTLLLATLLLSTLLLTVRIVSGHALHLAAHALDASERAFEIVVALALCAVLERALRLLQIFRDLIEGLGDRSLARHHERALSAAEPAGGGRHAGFGFVLLNFRKAFADARGRFGLGLRQIAGGFLHARFQSFEFGGHLLFFGGHLLGGLAGIGSGRGSGILHGLRAIGAAHTIFQVALFTG